MSRKMTPEEVVRAWNDCYSKRDVDGALKYMSPQFHRFGDCTRWTPIGKEPWAADQKGFFRAFPDWTWEMSSLMTSGNMVVCEFLEHGTFTKPYDDITRIVGNYLGRAMPGLVIQPTGESYSDYNADFIRVDADGLIVELRAYITNNLERTFHFEAQITQMVMAEQRASIAD
jgi:hypothetical protein